MNPASHPPCAKSFAGQPLEQPKRIPRSCGKLTYTSLASMFTFWNELAIMLAHWILRGLLVETNKVIEKSGGPLVSAGLHFEAAEATGAVFGSKFATKISPLAQ